MPSQLPPTPIPGWQSWSSTQDQLFRFPLRNFSPFKRLSVVTSNQNISLKPPISGWCSWYAFGKKINEKTILEQASWISAHPDIPLEYVLIDDGWETKLGDWQEADPIKFPHGLKFLVNRIRHLKLKPGIWIAPFLVNSNSQLAKHHSEWLVKDANGQYIEGSKFSLLDRFLPHKRLILDLNQPAARAHIMGIIDNLINEYKFELLKLDFLYAQHFNPLLKQNDVPDRLLSEFLQEIKDKYPHLYTIGCGCPLIPAIGRVSAMRISEDIAIPRLKGIPFLNSQVHSWLLKQLKVNLDDRYFTRQFWNLDPDVFIIDPSFGFTRQQILQLQKLIIDAGGLKFLGDDLTRLSPQELTDFILPIYR